MLPLSHLIHSFICFSVESRKLVTSVTVPRSLNSGQCYVIHPDIDHDNTSLTYQQSGREVNQQGAEREKTTVHISHPTYPLIKAEAEAQRYSVKEYINKILEQHLEKQEFLSKVVPDLSLDSLDYEINKLVIKDSRLGRLYNVYFRNFQMECETCRSSDCIHTRYAFSLTISTDYESTTSCHRLIVK